MSSPLLSICIPTFNRNKQLEPLLKSLSVQIDRPEMAGQVEIVISDNASPDGTQEIGEKWAARHSFVRYFRNAWNIGGDPNQLCAIERGKGKYAWVLGDDDSVTSDAVARILSYLKPGVTQLFLDYRCVTLEGKVLAAQRLRDDIPNDITTLELIKRVGYVSVFSLISSHVFDREALLAVDPVSLLRTSPWYILCMALIAAFHDKKCVLVRNPVLSYTAGNDRLPDETALYVRVIGLLNTLKVLEEMGAIDSDFLFGIYETGAGSSWTLAHPHYFREELFINLSEFIGYWALPGRKDWQLIRNFIDRGPGSWGIRLKLRAFFLEDYNAYLRHRKPVIHYWRGKAWSPAFSLLLSSDERAECEAFNQLISQWPEQCAHESILISRVSEEKVDLEHIDTFMAPFAGDRSLSGALNCGFRKALAPRVLVLNEVCSPAIQGVVKRIDDWDARGDAPASCLLFASASGGLPKGLLGLYLQRIPFAKLGAFENGFRNWSRQRLIADAGFRLGCRAWAVDGGEISAEALNAWFAAQLPGWLRLARRLRGKPLVEHGLNITLRHHFKASRV